MLLPVLLALTIANINARYYCKPSNITCWPNPVDLSNLERRLITSVLIHKENPLFYIYSQPKNDLILDRPSFMLLPSSNTPGFTNIALYNDIVSTLEFIIYHNLFLTIYSSGHSYPGRSNGEYIGNYSFQINFNNMSNVYMDLNNNDYNIIVEPGCNWGKIYKYIDEYTNKTRTVIGGGGQTVGPVGYILGGGHSPISRYFGLACDNVLSIQIITANMSFYQGIYACIIHICLYVCLVLSLFTSKYLCYLHK